MMPDQNGLEARPDQQASFFSRMMQFWIQQKILMAAVLVSTVLLGLMVAPFDWDIPWLPRNPVPVDAIPDIGENQQIVFTTWEGRSPKDIEDQVTYPLTVALLGVPGVKAIRSNSFFGFSTIYIIFKENVEFYWSRSRILEKLNSLPSGLLPAGVQPSLGPDATALGQVFWYTLEGQGFSLDELRTIQDYYVRYYLQSAGGVSEVASIGGFIKEYQIDINPDAMRAHSITLPDVFNAVRMSNIDVGAATIEVNRAEYTIRGLGFIRSIDDLRNSVVKVNENVPLFIKDVANVTLGPEMRRGALDKEGAEAVGGVVVVRFAENPLEVIKNVKAKIKEIAPGLPTKTLPDGRVSQVKIVPFYDRTQLIHETLDTLRKALSEEILVTIIVVIVMVNHIVSSALISAILPLAVLFTFMIMKAVGIDANIMALSGIAIAIGVMVDMGIILCENILRHMEEGRAGKTTLQLIRESASEVGGAVMTSSLTTIISFLPVFTLTGPEGKLFKPVAFTKTFAVAAALILALALIPPLAHLVFTKRNLRKNTLVMVNTIIAILGIFVGFTISWWIGIPVIFVALVKLASQYLPFEVREKKIPTILNIAALLFVVVVLTEHWLPLGHEKGFIRNFIFASGIIFGLLGVRKLFTSFYRPLLRWALYHKARFLVIPISLVMFGGVIWLGFERVFFFIPWTVSKFAPDRPAVVEVKSESASRVPVVAVQHVHGTAPATATPPSSQDVDNPVRKTWLWSKLAHSFPGLGKEFMPDLDEGSFLFMPTTMPHASIGEALDVIQKQDMAIRSIPEVESVVGKIGRVESALDPAPLSMIETVITYKPEYRIDPDTGQRVIDPETGKPVRNWRPQIKHPGDIWKDILRVAQMPGTTSAPKLQPIAARIVMLQSGMRAAMGVKIRGKNLEEVEKVGLDIERFLKEVPTVEPSSVVADRVVGNPYVEIDIDRKAIARYGIKIQDVQDVIEIAIGGKRITTTVEGRERYPVRVRYERELRDSLESLGKILVPGNEGVHIPLNLLATINYSRGPMTIKSEDTFLVSYVLFDKKPGKAEVDVVQAADNYLQHKIATGELKLPPGTSFAFAGSYENQVRSEQTLRIVIPLALMLIFIVLYFQFHSVPTSLNVFSGIFVAWSGGFMMIWLYSQPWFMDFSVFGVNMRDLFQVRPYNLSVAVWVGFLALFGIATNDGVIYSTYLDQVFARHRFTSIDEIREATLEAGIKRVRPALMTTAATILALIPVLTSTGKGADVMVPMALPSFGGMTIDIITIFVVPTIYCLVKEAEFKRKSRTFASEKE
ncbi:MAG TPA: efflux RND transporter permease subunit [Desulfomonilaceae bacterium]|nr:efflux RND transporter permease subunit [Desulfomonilaceae bacterium]